LKYNIEMCKFDGNWNIACNDYELWSTEGLLITLKKVLYYTNTWQIYFVGVCDLR
jgi:hypothetical protein